MGSRHQRSIHTVVILLSLACLVAAGIEIRHQCWHAHARDAAWGWVAEAKLSAVGNDVGRSELLPILNNRQARSG